MALPVVSDSGFDFKTPRRREAKRFDPPPWEREAFEQLERRSAAEAGEQGEAGPKSEESVEVAPQLARESKAPVGQGSSEKEGVAEAKPEIEEKRVLEMMAQLAGQEPAMHDKTWKPAIFLAMLAVALGCVMTVWGVAAMVRASETGLTGVAAALVLIAFGVGFVAVAVWMTVRTLRQRGVL